MSAVEQTAPQEHSLGKRYLFKVFATLVNVILSFLVAGVVPKSLGTKNFGDYSFVTSFFTQAIAFFDLRTSTCFYVKLSQEQKNKQLVSFYISYVLLIMAAFMSLVAVLAFSRFKELTLPGKTPVIIVLGAGVVFLIWLLDLICNTMDAYGLTVKLEKIRIFNKLVSVLILMGLYLFHTLDLYHYFAYQFAITLPIIFILIGVLYHSGHWKQLTLRLQKGVWRTYLTEFFKYTAPLIGYIIVNVITGVSDRFILQVFGGSSEQGLYGFSYGMMNVSSLFLTAVQPLMVREMSIAASQNNMKRMATLYESFYPLLFALTAYFCVFVVVEAPTIIQLLGGEQYAKALWSFRLVLILPLVGVFSGLNASIVYSTGRTRLFLIMSLINAPLGIVLLYFLVNPIYLGFGALGLALKSMTFEVLSTLVITIAISKVIGIRLHRCLMQFFFLLSFVIVAFLSRSLMESIFDVQYSWLRFLASGLFYTSIIAVIGWFVPKLLGIPSEECERVKIKIRAIIKRVMPF